MTAAKSLDWKEVERVALALRAALKAECPDHHEAYLELPPEAPKPASRRGAVLWEAHRLAWAASARFVRKTQREAAKRRGGGEAFFDDRQTDAAIASLERARTLVRNACAEVEKDIARIRTERARVGLCGDDVADLSEHAKSIEKLAKALDLRITKLKKFQGIPQARTRSEWDDVVSRMAEKLLAVGFGTREVAGLLTGRTPEAVDRATLEKFRQRINRLALSKG